MFYSYKYRIYPNKKQEQFINNHIGACRFIYNWGLNLRIKTYQETNKGISHYQTSAALTQLKQQDGYEWLYDINAQSLQVSLKNLDKAYTAFFKTKKWFPKFKSKKKTKSSYSILQSIKIENNELYIPKLKIPIKIIIDRLPIARIVGATISKTKSGKYFIAIKMDDSLELPKALPLNFNKSVGIDLGLSTFATLSNGKKIANGKPLYKLEKQLTKLQRQFNKKKKGSNKKEKLRITIAKLYEKITNQRNDFLHKISTQLANDSQVETYCLETLNIEGMMKNHKLAKSIGDVSWGTFIQYLAYKCERLGKNILHIGQFEPSSKMCGCGIVNQGLTLKDRIWTCSTCYITHDRDILAANNIKRFAFNQQNLLHIDNPTKIGPDQPKLTPVKSKKFLLVETESHE